MGRPSAQTSNVVVPHIPGYDVVEELGRGGMGVVYKAWQLRRNRFVALKLILAHGRATFFDMARFRIEAEAVACLQHPNIIRIHDAGVHAGHPYFALEFADGGTLTRFAAEHRPGPRAAAELVKALADAMQLAHGRGILHRDLKPANVLMTADGTPKITDFGLAKFQRPMREVSAQCCTMSPAAMDGHLFQLMREHMESRPRDDKPFEDFFLERTWIDVMGATDVAADRDAITKVKTFAEAAISGTSERLESDITPLVSDLTEAGEIMGSPQYMAPEQARGDQALVGPATDVYGLGAVLFYLLSGRPVFQATNIQTLLEKVQAAPPPLIEPRVDRELQAICERCLAKHPDERYASARALADDLHNYLLGMCP